MDSTHEIRVMRVISRMNIGGPAVEIDRLARDLDPSIYRQHLLTGWCADGEADYLATTELPIPVTRISGLGRRLRPIDDLRALVEIVREFRKYKPDVVHTHAAKAGVLGRLAALTLKPRPMIVHTYHGHILHGYLGPWGLRGVILVERGLAAISDKLIAVGRTVRDDLLGAGVGKLEKFSVIYSGVSIGPLPNKLDARHALGLNQSDFVVLMLGRLTNIKRPDRLLDTVEIVSQEYRHVRWIVAGGGDLENEMHERVDQEALPVNLLGWRSDIEVLFAASDVVILTSDNEGTPISLIQAGLAGVAVVATKVGSVPEVVVNEVTGLLVEPRADALAEAVVHLIRNPALRVNVGKEANRFTNDRFTTGRFIHQHALIYGQKDVG